MPTTKEKLNAANNTIKHQLDEIRELCERMDAVLDRNVKLDAENDALELLLHKYMCRHLDP